MKVSFEQLYMLELNDQVEYIACDKPKAARKFKIDLLKNLKKDLKQPYHFKKSIYFDNESIRDHVFKGYTSVYEIDTENNRVIIFGFIKHKNNL